MAQSSGPSDLVEFGVRPGGGRSYPVIVGRGAIERLPAILSSRPSARCAVVSDSNVAPLHGSALVERLRGEGRDAEIFTFEAGEASKTRATKEKIEDAMVAAGYGPGCVVIAAGGGVTGDLAGYVAATYMRGVAWVAVPTSLLAMADASIGGKTGVDHPAGKNLIGAYHQPIGVLSDTSFLGTLPAPERLEGLAEIVKAGVIADADLFNEIERAGAELRDTDAGALPAILKRSVGVKVGVVSSDERDADIRKILNFGHTVGHALERLTAFSIGHGRAVSIGMVGEARMAAALGLMGEEAVRRIEAVLAGIGLPTRLPAGIGPLEVLDAARMDKKARHGRLEYSLPSAIGSMADAGRGYSRHVPDEVAAAALA